jgi:polygalacturonase
VLITGIRIRANMKLPNADGIDLDRCRRVRISDCDIICADDGVSLKNCREFHEYGLCEDIGESTLGERELGLQYDRTRADYPAVVSNCTITSKSSGLVVGVETAESIRNATFTNCIIRASNRGLSVNRTSASAYCTSAVPRNDLLREHSRGKLVPREHHLLQHHRRDQDCRSPV